MIGLDTNIVVRYIAQDDRAQARKATEIIEKRLTTESPGFICAASLVEICWVLMRSYKIKAKELAVILDRLLRSAELSFEHRDEAWKALKLMQNDSVDFADAFIGLINQKHGCDITLTFDKTAGRMDFFEAQ